MPFDGNGTYEPPSPEYPAISGQVIYADDWNAIVEDIAMALSNCITRDGQSPALADISLGGFKITNLAAAVATGQAVRFDEFDLVVDDVAALATALALKGNITTQVWLGNHDFTGAVLTAATQAAGNNTTLVATTAFVIAQAFNTALPGQSAATIGQVPFSDGTNAFWDDLPPNLYLSNTFGAL